MMSLGATGVISVLSNVLPAKMQALRGPSWTRRPAEGARSHVELMPLFQNMFIEVNLLPVKETLYFMGMLEREMRLPLCPLTDKNREDAQERDKRIRAAEKRELERV